ncbi:MAG: hypothetical protein FWD12_08880, partial [Alphaproteobacteria bacterium]|nr:hypothetical protein [Alphaproteobacteria bacterium]
SNISRLTWDNLTANSGEGFARVDTPWNFFVKGFAGGGSINAGKIKDEDRGLGSGFALVNTGYSNTVGNAFGNLSYWTIDAGYDLIRGPGMKVGVFAGYNEYRDSTSSTSCTQIALRASGICTGTIVNTLVLGEDDKWQSVRVGGNAEVMLTDRFKLTAEWLSSLTRTSPAPTSTRCGPSFNPRPAPESGPRQSCLSTII